MVNGYLCLGGFLAGLIIPHDNGFAISIVEKLEDLVSITFLPLVCPCLLRSDAMLRLVA